MKAWIEQYALPFGASLTLFTLLVIAMIGYMREAKFAAEKKITSDIPILVGIFEKINDTCGIISFEHEVNYIDFLNVISFEGSRIGSMNLRYPDKWAGPYLAENPTIQEKFFEIIKTKDGYYIFPGNGIQFANGSRMGTDISIGSESAIELFLAEGGPLNYKGKPLAGKIDTLDSITQGSVTITDETIPL